MTLTLDELKRIISEIKYKDWKFNIDERQDCFTLKITFIAPDTFTGKPELQHCRKWFLSKHSCKAEIVRTAYKAVLAAEEHEVGENFLFKGVRIHSPHTNPDDLADVFTRGLVGKDTREERKDEVIR